MDEKIDEILKEIYKLLDELEEEKKKSESIINDKIEEEEEEEEEKEEKKGELKEKEYIKREYIGNAKENGIFWTDLLNFLHKYEEEKESKLYIENRSYIRSVFKKSNLYKYFISNKSIFYEIEYVKKNDSSLYYMIDVNRRCSNYRFIINDYNGEYKIYNYFEPENRIVEVRKIFYKLIDELN